MHQSQMLEAHQARRDREASTARRTGAARLHLPRCEGGAATTSACSTCATGRMKRHRVAPISRRPRRDPPRRRKRRLARRNLGVPSGGSHAALRGRSRRPECWAPESAASDSTTCALPELPETPEELARIDPKAGSHELSANCAATWSACAPAAATSTTTWSTCTRRLSYPFTNLVLALLGIGMSAREAATHSPPDSASRSSSHSSTSASSQIGAALGKNEAISPLLAAWLAPLIFGTARACCCSCDAPTTDELSPCARAPTQVRGGRSVARILRAPSLGAAPARASMASLTRAATSPRTCVGVRSRSGSGSDVERTPDTVAGGDVARPS